MPNAAQTDLAAALAVGFQPLMRDESDRPFAWRAEVTGTGTNGWTLDQVLSLIAPAEAEALACFCATLAIERAAARGLGRTDALLIVPVNQACATTGQAPWEIARAAHEHGLALDRIIVEISADERGCIESAERLAEACALEGLSVALGGFASGRIGLNLIARFKPRFALLDRTLVRNIGGSDSRRSMVEGTVRLARSLGTTLIAPAAETRDERDALLRLGVLHRARSTALRPLPAAVPARRAPRTAPVGTQRDATTRRSPAAGSFAAFEAMVSA